MQFTFVVRFSQVLKKTSIHIATAKDRDSTANSTSLLGSSIINRGSIMKPSGSTITQPTGFTIKPSSKQSSKPTVEVEKVYMQNNE